LCFIIIVIIIIIKEYSAKKKLLEHFAEVPIGNDNVACGNLYIRKFLGVA